MHRESYGQLSGQHKSEASDDIAEAEAKRPYVPQVVLHKITFDEL